MTEMSYFIDFGTQAKKKMQGHSADTGYKKSFLLFFSPENAHLWSRSGPDLVHYSAASVVCSTNFLWRAELGQLEGWKRTGLVKTVQKKG